MKLLVWLCQNLILVAQLGDLETSSVVHLIPNSCYFNIQFKFRLVLVASFKEKYSFEYCALKNKAKANLNKNKGH